MRAGMSCLVLLGIATTITSAADVPPPPSSSGVAPQAIFNSGSGDAPLEVNGAPSAATPGAGAAPAATGTTQQPTFYYSAPAGYSAGDSFTFGGYNFGLVTPWDGTIDDLFDTGVQVNVEVGQQWVVSDSAFRDFAITVGFNNATMWAQDNHNVTDSLGQTYGIDYLSISTLKTGVYTGFELGGLDMFIGAYGKAGVAVLNEDTEFFNPANKNAFVEKVNPESFAGGGGIEAGVNLLKRERSSLAFVFGAEYMYLGTFEGASADDWTLFTQSGFQWQYDITDGIFPERECRDPRGRRGQGGRRCRRGNRW